MFYYFIALENQQCTESGQEISAGSDVAIECSVVYYSKSTDAWLIPQLTWSLDDQTLEPSDSFSNTTFVQLVTYISVTRYRD